MNRSSSATPSSSSFLSQQQHRQNNRSNRNNGGKAQSQLLTSGDRTSPLLARQRYLPIEMHASLMPFSKSRKSSIPDLPHPDFSASSLASSITMANQRNVFGNNAETNSSLQLVQNLQQRKNNNNSNTGNMMMNNNDDNNNNNNNNNNTAAAGASSLLIKNPSWHSSRSISWSTKSAAIVEKMVEASVQRNNKSRSRGEQVNRTSRSSVVTPSIITGEQDEINHEHQQRQHLDDNDIDPGFIAKEMIRRRLQLQEERASSVLKHRPLSASSNRHHIQSSRLSTSRQGVAEADLMDSNWKTASSLSSSKYDNNNKQQQQMKSSSFLQTKDAIPASQQIQAESFSETGRGREPYPSQDKFGGVIRNDPSVAVQQVEVDNPYFIYHGPYEKNKKSGFGQYIVGRDGSSFLGNFKDGEINGQGTRYLSDGTVLQGTFKDGELHGERGCIFLSCSSSGERYEGGFFHGRRQGKGIMTWKSDECPVVVNDIDYVDAKTEANNGEIREEAVHRFEGDFEADEPKGVGIQTSSKIRRRYYQQQQQHQQVELYSKTTDTVEGFFTALGPQGSCIRNVQKKIFSVSSSSSSSSNHNNIREYFEGEYLNGKEHCDSCIFKNGKGIVYTGPMKEGVRAHVPNSLVLENVKVTPLEVVSKYSSNNNNNNNNENSSSSSSAQPQQQQSSSASAVPLGSGRKRVVPLQENISWLQPVSLLTGQEQLLLRVSLAHLNGFVVDDQQNKETEENNNNNNNNITALQNARKSFIKSLLLPSKNNTGIYNNNKTGRKFNGCSQEPLLMLLNQSSNNNNNNNNNTNLLPLINTQQYTNELQSELIDIAEEILITNPQLASILSGNSTKGHHHHQDNGGGGGASSLNANTVIAALAEDIKRELVLEENNNNNSNDNNSSTNNSPSKSMMMRLRSNSSVGHQNDENNNNSGNNNILSSSLRSRIAIVSSCSSSSVEGSSSSSRNAHHQNQKPGNGSARGKHNNNGNSNNMMSSFIVFAQSKQIEILRGVPTEIPIQMAPLQANPGDLFFVVVKILDSNVLLTPGGDEVNVTPCVPLVIPVQVGSGSGAKTPRGGRK